MTDAAATGAAGAAPPRSAARRVLDELNAADLAVFRAVEGVSTPALDAPLRRLSRCANHSKLWLTIAALLFAFGGRSGRRAALTGAAAIGLNSFIVNVPLKYIARRERPARGTHDEVTARHVKMPESPSFPSGHSASGFAFAQAVAATPARARPAAACARHRGRLLARAHRRALPGGRARGRAGGHGHRRGHRARRAVARAGRRRAPRLTSPAARTVERPLVQLDRGAFQ